MTQATTGVKLSSVPTIKPDNVTKAILNMNFTSKKRVSIQVRDGITKCNVIMKMSLSH